MLKSVSHYCADHDLMEPLLAVMLGSILTALVQLVQETVFRPIVRLSGVSDLVVVIMTVGCLMLLLWYLAWFRRIRRQEAQEALYQQARLAAAPPTTLGPGSG